MYVDKLKAYLFQKIQILYSFLILYTKNNFQN